MRLGDISLLGWIHTVPSLLALLLGAVILAMQKGTARHRLLGHWYFFALLIASLSGLPIFKGDLTVPGSRILVPGAFGFFHWLSLITLFVLAIGYFTATRQRHWWAAYLHPSCMIVSYYLLVGATINELFGRIDALRRLAGSHAATTAQGSILLGMVQSAAMLLFIVLLSYVIIKVALERRSVRGAVKTA